MSRRKRVLFVAYHLPPVGGVSVHRATKFIKYLPEFGWVCSVLTASNPSAPLFDDSLLSDIPPNTIIRKARTWEPDYAVKKLVSASAQSSASTPGLKQRLTGLAKSVVRSIGNLVLQPDPQILWRPAALKAGLKLLREIPHDAIIATGPPFSSLCLGATLARKTGVPLMLDYRDEWSISNSYWENKKQGRFANWIQTRMQRNALRAAQMVVATTPSSAAAVAREASFRVPSQCIYNGFDTDDFEKRNHSPADRKDYGRGTDLYRMSFVGTLWNLNSIKPLVEAILRLAETNSALVSRLELVCAGRKTSEQEAQLDRLANLPCHLVRLPFVEHTEAVQLMQSSDSLLMLNADLPETRRIINAKTYEYMAARRPVFVVAPDGDVWDILRDLPGTVLCKPAEIDLMAEKLAMEIERHRCGVNYDDAHWEIERFERRNLAGELAGLLDQMTGNPARAQLCRGQA